MSTTLGEYWRSRQTRRFKQNESEWFDTIKDAMDAGETEIVIDVETEEEGDYLEAWCINQQGLEAKCYLGGNGYIDSEFKYYVTISW